ncbi:MAG: YitT family protein [Acidaminococcaceae bacterium]|nr:YitT family protein [Acidaminococcaceae bacterium]
MNKSITRSIVAMLLGNFAVAAAVIIFIAPQGIILGGSTGIALALTHYISFPLSATVFVINMLFFVTGLICLGKKFALTTIANSILYPLAMSLLEQLPIAGKPVTDNIMLAAVFGGVLMGGGIGLLLRAGGSSGGTDIPALILNKHFHLNVSVLLYVIDGLVLCSQAFFSSMEQILYGIFVLALFTMTMNRIMLMGKSQIQLFIISDESEIIRQQILAEDAGATMFYVEKAFTGRQGKCIMCVIPRRKLYPITQLISATDPDAFFTISEVNEVRGAGFSFAKHYLDTTEKEQLSAK